MLGRQLDMEIKATNGIENGWNGYSSDGIDADWCAPL